MIQLDIRWPLAMHAIANNPYIFDCLKSAPDDCASLGLALLKSFSDGLHQPCTLGERLQKTTSYMGSKSERGTKLPFGLPQEIMMSASFPIPISLILERENNQSYRFWTGWSSCYAWECGLLGLEVRVAMQELLKRVSKLNKSPPRNTYALILFEG